MSDNWNERERPLRLEGRFEFPDYATLRDFLDRAAKVSEEIDLFPDMGFGRDYVNITIHADGDELTERERGFAEAMDKLATDEGQA